MLPIIFSMVLWRVTFRSSFCVLVLFECDLCDVDAGVHARFSVITISRFRQQLTTLQHARRTPLLGDDTPLLS